MPKRTPQSTFDANWIQDIEPAIREIEEKANRAYALIAGAREYLKSHEPESEIELRLLQMAADDVGNLEALNRIKAALPARAVQS